MIALETVPGIQVKGMALMMPGGALVDEVDALAHGQYRLPLEALI